MDVGVIKFTSTIRSVMEASNQSAPLPLTTIAKFSASGVGKIEGRRYVPELNTLSKYSHIGTKGL
jgi:hypothetical protein